MRGQSVVHNSAAQCIAEHHEDSNRFKVAEIRPGNGAGLDGTEGGEQYFGTVTRRSAAMRGWARSRGGGAMERAGREARTFILLV